MYKHILVAIENSAADRTILAHVEQLARLTGAKVTPEVAILSPEEHPDLQLMLRALWATYRPRLVAALATQPMPAGAPSLLEDRQALDGKPTAYVCQGFVCQRPVTTAAEMAAHLEDPALV